MTNVELDKYMLSSEGLKALNCIIKYTECDQMDGTYMAIGAKSEEVKRKIEQIESLRTECKQLSKEDEELLRILEIVYGRMEYLADEIYHAAEEFDKIISALQSILDRGFFDADDINKIQGEGVSV